MWEIVHVSLECQRAAFEAQARGLRVIQDAKSAGLATTDALSATRKAAEANAKAWGQWWRLWGGR